jgi:hypothetical protein
VEESSLPASLPLLGRLGEVSGGIVAAGLIAHTVSRIQARPHLALGTCLPPLAYRSHRFSRAPPATPNHIAAAIGINFKKFFMIYLFYIYKLIRS